MRSLIKNNFHRVSIEAFVAGRIVIDLISAWRALIAHKLKVHKQQRRAPVDNFFISSLSEFMTPRGSTISYLVTPSKLKIFCVSWRQNYCKNKLNFSVLWILNFITPVEKQLITKLHIIRKWLYNGAHCWHYELNLHQVFKLIRIRLCSWLHK